MTSARQLAKDAGKTRYTSKPCKNCGNTDRRVCDYRCPTCSNRVANTNRRNNPNPERVAYQKEYYLKNKERYKERYHKNALPDTVVYILTLKDNPNVPIYVGRTKNPIHRFSVHKTKRQILNGELLFKVVTRVDDDKASDMERHYIRYFQDQGYDLENVLMTD